MLRFFEITSLVFFLALNPAFADSYPYGSGAIPYLTTRSDVVATVLEITDLGDSVARLKLDRVHRGNPPATILTVQVHRKLPNAGDLVYLDLLTEEEKKNTPYKKEVEGVIVGGYHGVIHSGSARFHSALRFLKATSPAEKMAWATEELRSGDRERKFDGQFCALGLKPDELTEAFASVLLETSAPNPAQSSSAVWRQLSQTNLDVVKNTFLKWAKNREYPPENRAELTYYLTEMPSNAALVENWLAGRDGAELQNFALGAWLGRQSIWDGKKEKKFQAMFADPDPRVRVRAVDEIAEKRFFMSTPPFRMLEERLRDAGELPVIKFHIVRALGRPETGSFEASDILKNLALDKSHPSSLRLAAITEISRIRKFDLGKSSLEELAKTFGETGEIELAKETAKLIRFPADP